MMPICMAFTMGHLGISNGLLEQWTTNLILL